VGDRGIEGSGGDNSGRGDAERRGAGPTEQPVLVSLSAHANEGAVGCLRATTTQHQAQLKDCRAPPVADMTVAAPLPDWHIETNPSEPIQKKCVATTPFTGAATHFSIPLQQLVVATVLIVVCGYSSRWLLTDPEPRSVVLGRRAPAAWFPHRLELRCRDRGAALRREVDLLRGELGEHRSDAAAPREAGETTCRVSRSSRRPFTRSR
jgi:hypothetical protein